MKHSRAIELLPDLDAGDLRPDEENALLEHAEGCTQCQAWLETYDLFSETLGDPAAAHPSSEQLARHALGADRLTEPELDSLEGHLQECESCRNELSITKAALTHGRSGGEVVRFADWRKVAATPPMRWAAAAGILLALAVGFALQTPAADRELVGDRLAGVQIVEAETSISAESVTVQSGDITFRAGEVVSFSDGFSVAQDATFRVEVKNNPTTDNTPGAATPSDRNSKTS